MIVPRDCVIVSDGAPRYYATPSRDKQPHGYNGRRLRKKVFELAEDWVAQDALGTRYVVPAGFRYDLASIPPPLYWLTFGRWNVAAALHDWLYVYGELWFLPPEHRTPDKRACSRKQADQSFRHLLAAVGVGPIRQRTFFWAVRLFGQRRGNWHKLPGERPAWTGGAR